MLGEPCVVLSRRRNEGKRGGQTRGPRTGKAREDALRDYLFDHAPFSASKFRARNEARYERCEHENRGGTKTPTVSSKALSLFLASGFPSLRPQKWDPL